MTVDAIKRMHADLVALRQPHEQAWRDAFDRTFPARAHGFMSQVISATDAQQRKAVLYDSTAADGCKTGTATLMGTMVPSNALWFGLDLGEQGSDEERVFLDECAKFMWTNIHAGNFDSEAFDALLDSFVAGWFCLYADEDEGGGFYFEAWPIGECYVAASRNGKVVDTIVRDFTLTVVQAVTEYGLDAVSLGTREKYNAGRYAEKVRILHSIRKRAVYAVQGRTARNLPYESMHVEHDGNHLLREGGYHEFPVMVPRWQRLPGSAYATGPMSDALADVNTLNEVVKWGLMGAETAIAPPLKVVDDGTINPRNIRMGPRKILVCGEIENIQPLITGAKVEFADLKSERLQAGIRKMLLADHLPPVDGPVRTAYEWSVRVDHIRKMLGPMFGRFQSEFLTVLIERLFGITWRANIASGFRLVGKPPQSLIGRTFSVRYLSPLARSQRLEEVAAMDRYEVALAQEAQFDPSVLDVYDLEEAARERANLLGVPNKLIRDEQRAAEVRQARVQAQARAQQQAMAANGQAELQGAMAQRMANAT